jgi:cbb3-type cytochrome oxidase subunit 3
MLKFIKSHMSTIAGVDVTASIALVLFVLIFLYVVYYAFFVMDKDVEKELSSLPLQEDDLNINL